jgi:hypothetical protein
LHTATVAPGAWLQVQELDVAIDEATMGPAYADLLRILAAIWNKTGPGAGIVNHLEDSFKEAGLQNVHARRLELPAGKKLANEQDRKNSIEPFKLTIPNLCRGANGEFLRLFCTHYLNGDD